VDTARIPLPTAILALLDSLCKLMVTLVSLQSDLAQDQVQAHQAVQLDTIGMVPLVLNAIMLVLLVQEELTISAQHVLRTSGPNQTPLPPVFQPVQAATLAAQMELALPSSATPAVMVARHSQQIV